MPHFLKIFLSFFAFFILTNGFSQKDSSFTVMKQFEKKITPQKVIKKDTADLFSPRKATIRSAILPGWGQIYNKTYWKLPLVYGALGVTAGIFVYNIKTYKQLRTAYIYMTDNNPANDALIDPRFKNLNPESIRSYRNVFRQNVDYSALFFIAFWGLNVVDATVDAHLRSFNVNDNLSLQIKPGNSLMAGTSGLSLVLNMSKNSSKSLTSLP
jgi:hypothetical protein